MLAGLRYDKNKKQRPKLFNLNDLRLSLYRWDEQAGGSPVANPKLGLAILKVASVRALKVIVVEPITASD